MRKRLNANYLGNEAFLAEKRLEELSGAGESNNSEKYRFALKIMRNIIQYELSDRQRQMIELYYFKGLNTTEIGEYLGINRSTVSRTLSRAKKILWKG